MIRRDAIRAMAGAAAGALVNRAAWAGPAPSDPVEAFIAGFPLFEFARSAYALAGPTVASPEGRFNRLQHRRTLTDPASRIITTTNNDCLVSNSRIDLSGGPVVVTIPDITDRYFSAAFMDAFTDNFHFIGTRTTRGRGGRFALIPPGWHGSVPHDAIHVPAPTTDVWMLVRILVDGPHDYPVVNAYQDQLRIDPPPALPMGRALPVPPRDAHDPTNFLAVVNAMLARCPAGDPRVRRATAFHRAGLVRGDIAVFEALPSPMRTAWASAADVALARLKTPDPTRERRFAGWSYSLASTGDFGTDDFARAQIALSGLAALPPEEAFYAHGLTDGGGTTLNGAYRYRLRLPPGGVPADAFWSLTMYQVESDGRLFLVQNPIARYSIGDRTPDLIHNADGSLDLLLQQAKPEEDLLPNWLPAPTGPFRPVFRAYLARPELRTLKWRLPTITRLEDGSRLAGAEEVFVKNCVIAD